MKTDRNLNVQFLGKELHGVKRILALSLGLVVTLLLLALTIIVIGFAVPLLLVAAAVLIGVKKVIDLVSFAKGKLKGKKYNNSKIEKTSKQKELDKELVAELAKVCDEINYIPKNELPVEELENIDLDVVIDYVDTYMTEDQGSLLRAAAITAKRMKELSEFVEEDEKEELNCRLLNILFDIQNMLKDSPDNAFEKILSIKIEATTEVID